jgi:hypothetical protein
LDRQQTRRRRFRMFRLDIAEVEFQDVVEVPEHEAVNDSPLPLWKMGEKGLEVVPILFAFGLPLALSQPSSSSDSSAMLCTSTRSIISFLRRCGVRDRRAEPCMRLIML